MSHPRTTKWSKGPVFVLVLTVTALLMAGCGSEPAADEETEETTTSVSEEVVVDAYLPCMAAGTGGLDDKSFNQLSHTGLIDAAAALGVEQITVESRSETDYEPNIASLLDQGCDTIIGVGFDIAAALGAAAGENPEVEFVSVDDIVDQDFDGQTDQPNIKPIVFDTAQAAFLAGYAAASFTETGVVGTFGGMNFPTVATFMDGLKQGVDYFNETNGTAVEVIGWDGNDGAFVGGFEPNEAAKTTAQGLLDQGVDVLLPVGGAIYQSAVAAIRDSGAQVAIIGVDADFTVTDPSVSDLVLTSILKKLNVGVEEAIFAAGSGQFDPTPFVGTLGNGGVGIAPFHEFEAKVDPGLAAELAALEAAIISGELTVASYLSE